MDFGIEGMPLAYAWGGEIESDLLGSFEDIWNTGTVVCSNEGLLQTITSKIMKAITWLYTKIIALFKFITNTIRSFLIKHKFMDEPDNEKKVNISYKSVSSDKLSEFVNTVHTLGRDIFDLIDNMDDVTNNMGATFRFNDAKRYGITFPDLPNEDAAEKRDDAISYERNIKNSEKIEEIVALINELIPKLSIPIVEDCAAESLFDCNAAIIKSDKQLNKLTDTYLDDYISDIKKRMEDLLRSLKFYTDGTINQRVKFVSKYCQITINSLKKLYDCMLEWSKAIIACRLDLMKQMNLVFKSYPSYKQGVYTSDLPKELQNSIPYEYRR